MLFLLLALALVASVAGKCDNACSGHGTCGDKGKCTCYDNWGLGLSHLSGDCSQRVCPYEFAWVDSPDKTGTFHKYAECSNRGICNRDTGDCECFPGYEGKACARTTCPNDCSGHGQCKDINHQPLISDPWSSKRAGYFYSNIEPSFVSDGYKKWDSGKTRACVCDPEWGDFDCSKRMCQYGTDVMDQRQKLTSTGKYQVQHIHLQVDNVDGVYSAAKLASKSFALTFKSKLNETFTTIPIVVKATPNKMHDFVLDVTNALQNLPNGVIDHVKVQAMINTAPASVLGGSPYVPDNAFSFFDQKLTSASSATVTCKVSGTAITLCSKTLFGVMFGSKITAVTSTGAPVYFGTATNGVGSTSLDTAKGLTTSVAAVPSGTSLTLADTSLYTGAITITLTNLMTAATSASPTTGVTITSTASDSVAITTAPKVGYGAVVTGPGSGTVSPPGTVPTSATAFNRIAGLTCTFGSGLITSTVATTAGVETHLTITFSSVPTSVGPGFIVTGPGISTAATTTVSSIDFGAKTVTLSLALTGALAIGSTVSFQPPSGSLVCGANQIPGAWVVGMSVYGVGIPAGAKVTAAAGAGSTVTISPGPIASSTGSGNAITLYWPTITVAAITGSLGQSFTLSSANANAYATSTYYFALPPAHIANEGLGGAAQIGSDLLSTHNYIYLNITFDGNNVQGPQNPLMVKDILCGDGCTPKLSGLNLLPGSQNITEVQLSDYNSYECGRRGKCDYTTGQCQCFSGYTGLSCNVITSLV